jgi:hypothetical protein
VVLAYLEAAIHKIINVDPFGAINFSEFKKTQNI